MANPSIQPQYAPQQGILGFMIRNGLVSSKSEAEYVLVAVTVVAIFISLYFLQVTLSGGTPPPPPPINGQVAQYLIQ